MLEEAVVETIIEQRKTGDLVLLKKIREDACHHCNAKILCGVKSNFTFKAINQSSIALKPGDVVKYQLPNISLIKLSFLVYAIPLLSFLFIILLINWAFPNNGYLSAFFALIVMFCTFFVVGWRDAKNTTHREKRLPKIQKKIDKLDILISEHKTGGEFFDI
ncbi:MAG: SoxR reducing system RseC family protein [Bacteroidota bacterium]